MKWRVGSKGVDSLDLLGCRVELLLDKIVDDDEDEVEVEVVEEEEELDVDCIGEDGIDEDLECIDDDEGDDEGVEAD